MPTTRRGRLNLTTAAGRVRVYAPGYELSFSAPKRPPAHGIDTASIKAMAGEEFHGALERLARILSGYGFSEHIALSLDQVRRLDGGPAADYAMMTPGSSAPHYEVEVPVPAGHLVIAMTGIAGIVQWYLNVDRPDVLHPAAAPRGKAAASRARFLLPLRGFRAGTAAPVTALGLGSAIGGILRFFKCKIIDELLGGGIKDVIQYIADYVEAKSAEGLRYFDPAKGYPPLPDAKAISRTKPSLILVHGIFSSTGGCFEALNTDAGLMARLRSRYQDRIFGYDHRTISRTPLENAEHLLQLLPADAGANLDFVCHSRGALVTRAVLEHPDLVKRYRGRIGHVGNAIFVAGANQGSPLARYRSYSALFNIFSALGSMGGGIAMDVIVGVLKVLAHSALELDSIEMLAPDAPDAPNRFIRALDGRTETIERYCVAHANFDCLKFSPLAAVDHIVDFVFDGAANDLVVPFDGAAAFDQWIQRRVTLSFGSDDQAQGKVYHTNFFKQPQVWAMLGQELPRT